MIYNPHILDQRAGNPTIVKGPGRPKEVKSVRKKSITETVRNKAQKRKREQVMKCPKGTDDEFKPELRRSFRLKTQSK